MKLNKETNKHNNMYCPNCKTEHPGKFCPECGTKLIEKPATNGGFNFNLGDANAISGGINVRDSHDVHNDDHSVHNTSNVSNVTNNVTNVAAQKSDTQVHQENLNIYRDAFKKAYSDEVINPAERSVLFDLRMRLHLSKEECEKIESNVKLMIGQSSRSEELSILDKMDYEDFLDAINGNDINKVKERISTIEAIANNSFNDDVQYVYYMTLAVIDADKCIEKFEQGTISNYWRSFWSYIAYIKLGRDGEARSILSSLSKFKEYPEDNIILLSAVGAYIQDGPDKAEKYLRKYYGKNSPALKAFALSLLSLVNFQYSSKTDVKREGTLFYLTNIFCRTFEDRNGGGNKFVAKWDRAEDFSEGRAVVRDVEPNCKYGFIGSDGSIVISCKYDDAQSFNEGFAAVQCQGLWGFIDRNGKEITPFKYDEVQNFIEGYAAVRCQELWGFIDMEGREIVPCRYDEVTCFREGYARVNIDGSWGFIDNTDWPVIPCKYEKVGFFKEGVVLVCDKKYCYWGVINKKGEVVEQCVYDYAFRCSEGLISVCYDGKWGYIDKNGHEVIPCKYDSAWIFENGLARVKLNGFYGMINKKGETVIPFEYKDDTYGAVGNISNFKDGLAHVISNGKHGFIDKHNNHIVPYKYENAYDFVEGLALVKENGLYGYINTTGKLVIPCIYESASGFSEGLACVKRNDLYGYITKAGKLVIPCKYEWAHDFKEGFARVSLNGFYGFLKKSDWV